MQNPDKIHTYTKHFQVLPYRQKFTGILCGWKTKILTISALYPPNETISVFLLLPTSYMNVLLEPPQRELGI